MRACTWDPYFVNISTNIIENIEDFDSEEHYFRFIQARIQRTTREIEEIEKKIKGKTDLMEVDEKALSTSEPTSQKSELEKMKKKLR